MLGMLASILGLLSENTKPYLYFDFFLSKATDSGAFSHAMALTGLPDVSVMPVMSMMPSVVSLVIHNNAPSGLPAHLTRLSLKIVEELIYKAPDRIRQMPCAVLVSKSQSHTEISR